MKRWNPLRPYHSWLNELRCELLGVDVDEAPTTAWGWLTQFGKCVFVTVCVAGTVLMLTVGVSILGGGK